MVWIGSLALFGEAGLLQWAQLRRERAGFGDETMRLTRETYGLEQAIARLAQGHGLEAMAREQLGLVRPGEVVYRFRRPPTSPR
jgi:cell division protein FtsB